MSSVHEPGDQPTDGDTASHSHSHSQAEPQSKAQGEQPILRPSADNPHEATARAASFDRQYKRPAEAKASNLGKKRLDFRLVPVAGCAWLGVAWGLWGWPWWPIAAAVALSGVLGLCAVFGGFAPFNLGALAHSMWPRAGLLGRAGFLGGAGSLGRAGFLGRADFLCRAGFLGRAGLLGKFTITTSGPAVRPSLTVSLGALSVGVLIGSLYLSAHLQDPAASLAHGATAQMVVTLKSDPFCRAQKWGGCEWEAEARINRVLRGNASTASRASVVLTGESLAKYSRSTTLRLSGQVRKGFRDSPPSIGVARVLVVKDSFSPGKLAAFSNRVRQTLQQIVTGLPSHASGLVPGMAVGDERQLDPELRNAMVLTSLVHLTAVSGAHLSIALGVLAAVIPGGRYVRASLAVAFSLLLVVIVGPEPSVIRAVAMCNISAWGLAGRRRGQPQVTLCLVVIACVFIDPWISIQYGFALSVLATFGLLVTGLPLMRLWRSSHRGLRFFADAGAVTLAAQLWALPVLVTLDNSLPLVSPLANILVAPVVPVITVLGMLAAGFGLWSPWLAGILCWMATPFTWWLDQVARVLAGTPYTRLPWLQGFGGVAMAIALIGLAVAWQVRREVRE